MSNKRVIQLGHLLAMVFVALLLAGAHGYLGAHPLLAGLMLAAFAIPYYAAARITGEPQFLFPMALLLVLAHQLLLDGAGLPLALQPLSGLLPVAVITIVARLNLLRRPARASQALYGANEILIGGMSLWILFGLPWFFQQAALGTALALAGYSVYAWLRFRDSKKILHSLALVLLGSGAFLFLIYWRPQLALLLATAGGLLAGAIFRWFRRAFMGWPEMAALSITGLYLLYMGAMAPPAQQMPLGYLVAAIVWLQMGLALSRPEQPDILGPRPPALPRLLPLFGAGIVLALAPVALFYPWKPVSLAIGYLAVFSFMFVATANRLSRNAASLMGVVLVRLIAGLGRIAPVAALCYIACEKFPAGYALSLAALSIGVLSLLWTYRLQPRILLRRNYNAYQAGILIITAFFLAEHRLLSPASSLALASGAAGVLLVIATAWLIRKYISPASLKSLYEVASLGAIVAVLLYAVDRPIQMLSAAELGIAVILVTAAAFFVVRDVAVLFTVSVVLGFWVYVAEWSFGVRGEYLGTPYLLFGFACAGIGYWLWRRASQWYHPLYFTWFLAAAVSLAFFYPFQAAGSWLAPLCAVAFVVVARAASSRRDLPFASALEVIGALLAIGMSVVLLWQHLWAPAALALGVYALLYAWTAVRYRVSWYVYPAAACAVAAFHLQLLAAGWALLSLPAFLPMAVALSASAAVLRRRKYGRWALPIDLAVGAGVILGAAILLSLPFGQMTTIGWLAGIACFVLYLLLSRSTGERFFLAGAGLASAFVFYEFLPLLPGVTAGNRIGFLIPVALAIVFLGRLLKTRKDGRAAWALYAAAIVITVTASFVVLWSGAAPVAARFVLLAALAVWLALLISTEREIFIYCGTLTLAILAYYFVQSSTDLFGRHLVAFFLWGTAVLGLVFVAALLRNVVRFRRPTLFFPPAKLRYRFVYALPVGLLAVATFGSWGVETSSNPVFCGTCHEMRAYFGNWKASTHAKSEVGCAACHYEPGLRGYAKAKMQGFSELVNSMTGSQAKKPMARVDDENCLSSGCHTSAELSKTRYARGLYYFNHATHLRSALGSPGLSAKATAWRGPELRCTSCHTDVGPESHFAVDTNACFTCHFETAGNPKPAIAGIGCVACHELPRGARGPDRFEHVAAGVTRSDDACGGCHDGLSRGSVAVEQRQCRHCHLDRTDTLLRAGTAAIHNQHVRVSGIGCDWCHGEIRHRREPARLASTRGPGPGSDK